MGPVLKLGCRHRILRNVTDRTHSRFVAGKHHRDGRTTRPYTYFSETDLPSREPHGFDAGQIASLLTCINKVGAEGFEPPTAGV